MKQSFLDSLKGLFTDQAEALVEAEGYEAASLPVESATAAMVIPGVVYLWINPDNTVEIATPSDPGEVEET